MQITVEDIIGSTGLELKVDPGVPWVYAGFAGDCPRSFCKAHQLSSSQRLRYGSLATSRSAHCTEMRALQIVPE